MMGGGLVICSFWSRMEKRKIRSDEKERERDAHKMKRSWNDGDQ